MYSLRENPEDFPMVLSERKFNLDEWILTMETNVTSTGKDFEGI